MTTQTALRRANVLAWRQIPHTWYEKNSWLTLTCFVIAFVIQVFVVGDFWRPTSLWLFVFSVSLHLGGDLWDTYTTDLMMKQKSRYDARGIPFNYIETNKLLPDYVTLRQQIFSLPTLLTLLYIPIIWYLPTIGFTLGWGSLLMGLNNLRLVKRQNIELVVFDEIRGNKRV